MALGSWFSVPKRRGTCLPLRHMPRDHRQLRVFIQADELVLRVYHATRGLPVEERFGLQAQIRRAAVSAASNLVEGSARSSEKAYRQFVSISFGSAAETQYLFSVVRRLTLLPVAECERLEKDYENLLKGLNKLLASIGKFE